ncbi:hypothetical protein GQ43DRAFT_250078 [Delitschia confertaspora ATCC 74209]|uniref:Uncharacterized protein n=1 Tax=Delitschia confertaspora ATCC 74209 TaxID=1513339 RepID=A0A9P4JW88_9PLEO|nr:hypothetical protein GQ43DRAFT_250078 [Delitschia confertaspora ATCC 74209]
MLYTNPVTPGLDAQTKYPGRTFQLANLCFLFSSHNVLTSSQDTVHRNPIEAPLLALKPPYVASRDSNKASKEEKKNQW